MAIKNGELGGTDWSTPQARVKPTDLNDTFDEAAKRIQNTSTGHDHDGTDSRLVPGTKHFQVYTGTGFDTSVTGALQDTSTSQELTTITSANLASANYVKIRILYTALARQPGSDASEDFLKIETKDVGGSYSDSLAETRVLYNIGSSSTDTNSMEATQTLEWTHTLTANEKTNGITIRVTSRCVTGNAGACQASVTNVQTTTETMF